MTKRLALAFAFAALAARAPAAEDPVPPVRQDSVEARLERLEEGQKKLERAMTIEVQRRPAEPWTREGFWLAAPDDEFKLRIGGMLQADARAFSTTVPDGTDTFVVRRARIYIEGDVHKHVSFRILPDFAPGQQSLQEAWLDFEYLDEARLRVGKMKEPLGLERDQADVETVFIERGLPSAVAPNRDVGADFHGRVFDRRLRYDLALVNGAADGASTDADADNDKDATARVIARPFRGEGGALLERFGVGFAAGLGRARGAASVPSYASESQQKFFSYLSGVAASGPRRRLMPMFYWYLHHFGILAEYVQSRQDFSAPGGSARLTTRAWQVQASWVLTGETRDFNRLTPRRRFQRGKGWGAFELAARYSALWVDRSAFPVFADPSLSARRADAETAGLNWYLSSNVRLSLDAMRTVYAGGARSLEQAAFTRLQMSF